MVVGGLKACPFCKSPDLTVRQNNNITFVVCEPCGAVVSFHGNESLEATRSAWNRRDA